MSGQFKAWGLSRAVFRGVTAVAIAAGALVLANSPILVTAAETPRDILEKERRDPAAGEVVIINRKPAKTAAPNPTGSGAPAASTSARTSGKTRETPAAKAPDPYAPSGGAGATASAAKKDGNNAERSSRDRIEATGRPATTQAPAGPPARETAGLPMPGGIEDGEAASTNERMTAPPPPPVINREARPRRAARADDDAPPAELREGRSRPSYRGDDDDDREERWSGVRRPQGGRVIDPPPGYRPLAPERRLAEREPPRWRGEERSFDLDGRRPWRLCRRLAWRCQDGFERACWRWRERCM